MNVSNLDGPGPAAQKKFWEARADLDKDEDIGVDGEHRCTLCNAVGPLYKTSRMDDGRMEKFNAMPCDGKKAFASERGCKSHEARCKGIYKTMSFAGSAAAKCADHSKHKHVQVQRPTVLIGTERLDNVYKFRYLGHWFTADSDATRDVKMRLGEADSRMTALNHVWKNRELPMHIKIDIYRGAVCSVLSYCNEAWIFDEKLCGKLQDWNGKRLARITGNEVLAEKRHPTFDLVNALKARRLKWLGHILAIATAATARTATRVPTRRLNLDGH